MLAFSFLGAFVVTFRQPLSPLTLWVRPWIFNKWRVYGLMYMAMFHCIFYSAGDRGVLYLYLPTARARDFKF